MTLPKRILLIDDEPRLTTMVEAALQATGQYLIRRESYGRSALDAALRFQPDLILLDVAPAHLEDDPIAHQIQGEAALRNVPVVCLTSLDSDGRIGAVGTFGGYTFLAKSFLLQDMVSCIGEMLHDNGGRRLARVSSP
jgi:DNA-binding response OmpR family regulator